MRVISLLCLTGCYTIECPVPSKEDAGDDSMVTDAGSRTDSGSFDSGSDAGIPDANINELPACMGALWVGTTDYNPGDIVYLEGSQYVCIHVDCEVTNCRPGTGPSWSVCWVGWECEI